MTNRGMKILILGGSGMIGHKMWQVLSHEFPNTYVTLRRSFADYEKFNLFKKEFALDNFNINSFTQIKPRLDALNPDFILNCIGVTIRRSEIANQDYVKSINSDLPHQLDEWCKNNNSRLIHFSTDCVFSGNAKQAYTEYDLPEATDPYGASKGKGEVINSRNTLTLRASMIGPEIENFTELYEWFLAQNGKTVTGFDRVTYSGITTLRMAEYVSSLLKRNEPLWGLYNVATTPISKYDLLVLIKEIMGLKDIMLTRESSKIANKALSADRFFIKTGLPRPSWDCMLGALKEADSFYKELRKI